MTATAQMTLSEFLLARIAEDEEAARAAIARNGATWLTVDLGHNGARITGATEFGNPRSYRGDDSLWDDEGALGMFEETAAHVVRHDPARVLAECEAKRQMVQYIHRVPLPYERNAMWGLIALPYTDHPDYREEWQR